MKLNFSGTILISALLLSFSSVFSQTIWSEDFTYPNGTVMGPAGKWSATCGACLSGDYYEVRSNALHGSDVNDFSTWMSEVINISGCSDVSFSLTAAETGDHEGPGCSCGVNVDYFDVSYSIDGGPYVIIEDWNGDGEPGHTLTGDTQNGMATDADWGSTMISQGGLLGNTLQLRVVIRNTAGSEVLILDDVVVNCTPLPVEMVSLEAIPQNEQVEIRWETAMELGSAYFDVERSRNGSSFFSIGRVASAGNSDDAQQYSFTDFQPSAGPVWYRLRQVDQDGSSTLTQVIQVNAAAQPLQIASIAPNPATTTLQVAFSAGSDAAGALKVYDLMGQMLKSMPVQFRAGENNVNVAVADLPSGMYILRAQAGQHSATQRFLVR